MTEFQKMVKGLAYDPVDPELCSMRHRASTLCVDLNSLAEEYTDERNRLVKELLPNAKDKLILRTPFLCDYGVNVYIGDSVFINFGCVCLDVAPVRIGDRVLIGPNVQIYTATHPTDYQARRKLSSQSGAEIAIGDDAWICGGVILCPGVNIGSRSVIGAGSVVTRDIPDGVLAVGNPCRVLRGL